MRIRARLGGIVAALVILAVTLAGCAAPRDEGGPDPGMRGQWELINATDTGGTIVLANQLISLTIARDDSTNGRSTCSNYTARIYGAMANLWVTATLPRAEHCGIQAQEDIEQRYIDDLNQVKTATVVGGVMNLLAPGIDLRFQRALVVPLGLIVDRTWKLATVSADSYYATGNPTPIAQTGASLYFSKNGKLGGSTGCRSFTANYVENAGEIVADTLKFTVKGRCTANDVASDTYVVSVIEAGFTFISGAGQLDVSSPRAEIRLGFVD